MPPRRSTRATASTSASQPNTVLQPAAKKAAPRRKRPDADDSDDEFTAKPAKKKSKVEEKKVDDAVDDAADDADNADDSKMVTVLKRGAAPVDPASSYVCT
jgi:poly [ADP-ribose] polymerase 2/3/4